MINLSKEEIMKIKESQQEQKSRIDSLNVSIQEIDEPKKVDFFNVSYIYDFLGNKCNIRFDTEKGISNIMLYHYKEDKENLKKFLEAIIINEHKCYFISSSNKRISFIITETIDETFIKVKVISNGWFDGEYNTKISVVELIEKEFENSKYGVLLDIIVDKKYFIYSFYTELSFTELDKEDIKLKDVNFNIFDKYLGYIPSTEKEKKLKDCLYEDMPDLNKIEQLLKEGANPNALLDGYDIETLFESFLHDFNCYNDFDTSNLNLSNHKYTNLTNRNERIYCELRDKLYDIIKLFLKYGGKPRDIFCAIYSETRTLKKVRLLLDGHCKYSMNTLGFVSTDTWIGGDRWCERFYGALDKMFTKYHNFYSYECDENLKIVYRYSE